MTVEIPMRFEAEPLLWVVEDVYSEHECDQFIELIEASSPRLATDNAIYRDQDRVIRDDPQVAGELFRRLKPHLPQSMGSLRLVGVNDRLRFYRYRPGQKFLPHMDHWYQPSPTRITLLTVLVYFNENFEGGETLFQEQLDQLVRPKKGMVALFQHKIRHEGCAVISGTKYAMRSDVFYESQEPIGHAG
jgi:prolyl 4-hydroxylase